MSMFWHCSYCWDNPCTCSPEARERHRSEEAEREARWKAAYQKLTPAERVAYWQWSAEIPPAPTPDPYLSAMAEAGRQAGQHAENLILRVLTEAA